MQDQLPRATARLARRCCCERHEDFALFARRECLPNRPLEPGFPARSARPELHSGLPLFVVLLCVGMRFLIHCWQANSATQEGDLIEVLLP